MQFSHDYLLVNFGGPRSLEEIRPFLTALLTDRDTVRSKLPFPLHDLLFRRIAKKRAKKVAAEYMHMGGRSPIYDDTEAVKDALQQKVNGSVMTYHRFLPATHDASFAALEASEASEIYVFPMYPQFSYATTGSAARQLFRHLSPRCAEKLRWVKSYGDHPAFVSLFVHRIAKKLENEGIQEEDVVLLFSAHGIPIQFVKEGDPYLGECQRSFRAIAAHFPRAISELAFQSQFGPEEWIRPYTSEVCNQVGRFGRKVVLFIPLSFTSDHLETLIEIEQQYRPVVEKAGMIVYRLDAFNRGEDWIDVIQKITNQFTPITTRMLIRNFQE